MSLYLTYFYIAFYPHRILVLYELKKKKKCILHHKNAIAF